MLAVSLSLLSFPPAICVCGKKCSISFQCTLSCAEVFDSKDIAAIQSGAASSEGIGGGALARGAPPKGGGGIVQDAKEQSTAAPSSQTAEDSLRSHQPSKSVGFASIPEVESPSSAAGVDDQSPGPAKPPLSPRSIIRAGAASVVDDDQSDTGSFVVVPSPTERLATPQPALV